MRHTGKTDTQDRRQLLARVRKLVRGVGCVRRVWRLSLAELRRAAHELATGPRKGWLTARETDAVRRFLAEDAAWAELICAACDRICVTTTCSEAHCETCCADLCADK